MILENKTTLQPAQTGDKGDASNGFQDRDSTGFDQVLEAETKSEAAQVNQADEIGTEEFLLQQVPGKVPERNGRRAQFGLSHLGDSQKQNLAANDGSYLPETRLAGIESSPQKVREGETTSVRQGGQTTPDAGNSTTLIQGNSGSRGIDLGEISPLPAANKLAVQARPETGFSEAKLRQSNQTTTNRDAKDQNHQRDNLAAGTKIDHKSNTASSENSKTNDNTAEFSLGDSRNLLKGNSPGILIETVQMGNVSGLQTSLTQLSSDWQSAPADIRALPQRTIQLIAQAASVLQDRPVELTLNPEELGRVRMTLRSIDGAMAVTITVERPETLDLLRRNIDLLGDQLRDIGYEKLSFEFAGQGKEFSDDSNENNDQSPTLTDSKSDTEETDLPTPARVDFAPDGGIDIRL